MRCLLFLFLFFPLLLPAQTVLCTEESVAKLLRKYTPPSGEKFCLKKLSPDQIEKELAGKTDLIAVTEKIPEKNGGYQAVPFAVRGEIIAVHPKNPLRELPEETARELSGGKISDWQRICNHSGRIRIYFVEGERVLPAVFHTHQHGEEGKKIPGAPRKRRPLPVPTISDGKSYTMLVMDPDGMALFSLKRLDETRVPLLKINGIAPTYDTVRNLQYPLMKVYYLIVPEKRSSRKIGVLQYIRSRKFAAGLYEENFLPLLYQP